MNTFDFSRCPGYCERARKIMIEESHPLIAKRRDEPKPSMIPVQRALELDLEELAILREKIEQVEKNIQVLRATCFVS